MGGPGGSLRKTLVIAGTGMRRLLRDRTFGFFLFVAPLGLVLILGAAFGGGFTPGLGVVAPADDPLAEEVVAALEDDDEIEVSHYDSAEALRLAVERGSVQAGVVMPDDYAPRLREGEPVELGFLARPVGLGAELQTVVLAATGPQSARVQAAQIASGETQGTAGSAGTDPVDFDSALAQATELERDRDFADQQVTAITTTVGEELFPSSLGQFDLGASSQVLLFVFVNGVASAAVIIQSRELGVARRMLSTPTSARVIVMGEALGRLGVTLFQGVYIMVVSWLLFGVDWGDPVGAGVLILVFAMVAASASMLIGALFNNAQQVQTVAVFGALGLAALGGSMAPLEVFSPLMRDVAHVTPHAWGNDAFATLVRHDGGVLDILPELGVLLLMTVVLASLASWRLRRRLTTA